MLDSEVRRAYSTDLTDEQWSIIEPVLSNETKQTRRGRRREVSLREVVNAIFYIDRTGCQWDLLPHDLRAKSTVYDYFARWRDNGKWNEVLAFDFLASIVTSFLPTHFRCLHRLGVDARRTGGCLSTFLLANPST